MSIYSYEKFDFPLKKLYHDIASAKKKGVFDMKTYKILLDSIDKVKDFVNLINRFKSEIDLASGRYVVDAKSIMGIFSLELSKPLLLTVYGEDELEDIENALKPFILD